MGIGGIGPINNYNEYQKITKKEKTEKVFTSDSVNISQEAISKADTKRAMEIVKNAPDVRLDKIAELKERMKNPNYINDTIISGVADKIMDVFKI
ncbi:MAG: flagellar biosynthesis anti-sigma factor FlgM [Spirochaetes bacterium]|nr:flagellar biosynthesis anti-sigma factor FlgM [Spirochaetota bacterium]